MSPSSLKIAEGVESLVRLTKEKDETHRKVESWKGRRKNLHPSITILSLEGFL